MKTETSKRDKEFIDRQRERLTELLNQLSITAQADQAEETGIQSDSTGEAREAEDDAQRLTLLEIDGSLSAAISAGSRVSSAPSKKSRTEPMARPTKAANPFRVIVSRRCQKRFSPSRKRPLTRRQTSG